MGSPALDRILELETTDERVQQIRMMTEEGRRVLWDEWSQDPRCRATDVVALPMVFQVPLVRFIVGDPQRGLTGSGVNFYVRPNPNWEPPASIGLEPEVVESMKKTVLLENGTRGKGRQYVPIRCATVCPSAKGIQAMLQFGPTATSALGRGRLEEISAQEYALETAGAEQKGVIDEALSKAENAVDENKRLRAELAALKKRRNR